MSLKQILYPYKPCILQIPCYTRRTCRPHKCLRDDMVKLYNETKEEYVLRNNAGDEYDNPWVVDNNHRMLAKVLKSRHYHALVRSSIAPFFTIQHRAKWIEDNTKAYFEAHGGYEEAHKANFTVWNPEH